MESAKEKLHEINEMAAEYQLFLISQRVTPNDAKKSMVALQALYWQAGEQMEKLLVAIENKPVDGFTFRMLIVTAYSILDSLEIAAKSAKIGKSVDKKYTLVPETHSIKLMKLYGKRKTGEVETTDRDYLKFLRSFISAHPMGTTRSLEGFMPDNYAFCKFVDHVSENPALLDVPPGADYYVQVLDGGKHWDEVDFYINSSEIWAYVKSHYLQLIDTIRNTMVERIANTIENLKNTQLPTFPDEANLDYLDKLVMEDWKRGGNQHEDLMRCKLALQSLNTFQWEIRPEQTLKKAIWRYVQKISNTLQNMEFENEFGSCKDISVLMSSIGCDHNQCSNLWDMLHEQYAFGIDCEDYEEWGVNNYQKCSFESEYNCAWRRKKYPTLLIPLTPELNQNERIGIVTACYQGTYWPRSEIARIYFLVVLPEFVNKYHLYDKLCEMESYELFQYLIACALIETEESNE